MALLRGNERGASTLEKTPWMEIAISPESAEQSEKYKEGRAM